MVFMTHESTVVDGREQREYCYMENFLRNKKNLLWTLLENLI